jgi:hypothetical protein
VDLRIAIDVYRIDPPEGSIRCEHGASGEPTRPSVAFAGWLELLVVLQTLVDDERDQAAR